MVSDKQREFNRYMDDYIKRLPKKRRLSSGSVFFHKKRVEEKPEVLEEKELEKADKGVAKRGFFSRLYEWIFGSKATVITEEGFDEEVEQRGKKPEIKGKKRIS